jgi:Zn-dependent M16 (insulinase) family peptidase
VAEINTRARLYRHIKTGAEVLSMENDDENKVFGITFRTPPADSTGLPHIMEHSVLCGSRKYQVKEPFVELMKGSLNTFLNAMTYPDKTCYPVASQNLQDFYNLVDVYLDSVFYPLISPYTLQQEGWHYELDSLDGPLTYKGVVFNEMKGAYSTPDAVLGEQIQHALYPDTSYAVDSGGDPTVIPDLTYQQFKTYHDTYYHPSNARIYFYGNDDPDKRLEILAEYLNAFEAIQVNSTIQVQKPFAQPRRTNLPYEIAPDQEDAKTFVTVNWLLAEIGDPELTLGLTILEQVLIGSSAAQLRKALIDSGLGEDLTGSGLETGMTPMFFSTGLKGVAAENIEQVEKLIIDTLAQIALEGVDKDNIAAAINTLEFRLRENNTGSYPRGLVIMLRSLEPWLHGKDPLAPLAFEAPLQAIKDRLASGEPYLEHLIEAYLVNNSHRTTVILSPDAGLAERRAAAEQARLDAARAGMTQEVLQGIIEQSTLLHTMQETPDSPEALATIPMLDRKDLDKEIRKLPSELVETTTGKILFHDLFTNGILYLDLGFDMHVLPQELLPYMPLFGQALLETGTKTESFVQLLQRIGRTTGGIYPTTLTSQVRGTGSSVAWFFLRGKAMAGQAGELLSILQDVLTGANLEDRERFRQMALEEKATLESRLVQAGHAMVNNRLRAHFNEADWAIEQMSGISYLFFLRDMIQRIDSDWASVLQPLQTIRERLINRGAALVNVTIDAVHFQQVRPQLEAFLGGLPSGSGQRATWVLPAQSTSEGLTIPSQVNFVGKGADLYKLGYELNGSAFVISNYLRGTWLWEKVRVQGGAYGGFCTFDNQSGVFNFLSYRDPNLAQTLQSYDGTARFLQELELNDAELSKSIIGTIGDFDAYQLPDAKGYTALRFYLLGNTDAARQKLRDEVLGASLDDFRRFGAVLERLNQQAAVVVLGSAGAIEGSGLLKDVKKVL